MPLSKTWHHHRSTGATQQWLGMDAADATESPIDQIGLHCLFGHSFWAFAVGQTLLLLFVAFLLSNTFQKHNQIIINV
jgi:hypothetical protein